MIGVDGARVEGPWCEAAGRLVLPAAGYARNRASWLRARRSGLGASDTAAVLGLDEYASPLEVWQDKVATGDVTDDQTEAMEWGTVLEAPVARSTVRRFPHLGALVPTPGLLAHEEHGWMLATVDRGLRARGNRAAPVGALLEVKTTSRENYRANWIDGVPPAAIQVQVQQQLAVTGLPVAWVTVLVGGQRLPDPVRVERNDDVVAQLVAYAGAWWADHVVAGVRPEPTFADRDQLGRLWVPDDTANAVTADDDLEAWVGRLIDARRRKKEAEEDEEAAAFELKTAMRERTAIVDRGGDPLVTWKGQSSSRVDVKALRAERPDVAAEFTRDTVSRVLRVKGSRER